MFINSQRFNKMLVYDTFEYLTSKIIGETKQSSANLFTLTTPSHITGTANTSRPYNLYKLKIIYYPTFIILAFSIMLLVI